MNMTSKDHTTITNDHDAMLPADLADIAAMLDRLGSADRASMPRGMAERIGEVSMAALLHPEGADAAEHAGAIAASAQAERELVPAGLEDRVFAASRGELAGAGIAAGGGGLKLVGEGGLPPRRVARPVWWRTGAARMAAAVAVIGSGAAIFVAMQRSVETTTGPDASVLAASFDSELDTFFDLLDSTPSAVGAGVGIGTDHSITDTLLEWESL